MFRLEFPSFLVFFFSKFGCPYSIFLFILLILLFLFVSYLAFTLFSSFKWLNVFKAYTSGWFSGNDESIISKERKKSKLSDLKNDRWVHSYSGLSRKIRLKPLSRLKEVFIFCYLPIHSKSAFLYNAFLRNSKVHHTDNECTYVILNFTPKKNWKLVEL